MSMLHAARARLRALFRRSAGDLELGEEIRFHIELETEKNLRLGMSATEARRLAVAHFGGVQRVREEHGDVRRPRWLADFATDARFTLRAIRRAPALASTAVVTLALGIAANVAIFSAVNAVILRPLPFPSPDRLMMIGEDNSEKRWHMNVDAPANYLDWRAGVSDFADAAAYTDGLGRALLTVRGETQVLTASTVTGSFFQTLGVRAALGRTFHDEETWQSAARVAVLSDRAWRERFGGDTSIVGTSVTLFGRPTQIVGVMPPGFAFPDAAVDVWLPTAWNPASRDSTFFRRAHWLRVVARLRPGASVPHADAQLQTVVNRLKGEYPATNRYMGATMVPLQDFLIGDSRLPLLVLLTSVAFLLLIACANVGNLLLVQAAGRERETALRLALGAGRSRLVRQALAESAVLATMGGALGLALGWAGTRWLVRLQPKGMLRVTDFGVDPAVLVYVVAISVASALLFGVGPALWMRRRDPAASLRDGGRGAARGRQARRWANTLVVGEVALALMLTVGAGLLVRSLLQLSRVDAGFDPTGVLAVELAPLGPDYRSPAKVQAFMTELVARARAIPGVSSAATTQGLPLTGNFYTSDYVAAGRPADGYGTEVAHLIVSPEYFATMKVPVLRGRAFTADDRSDGAPVVLINDVLARSYFAGQDPVGQRIAFDKAPTPTTVWYTILGVVRGERSESMDRAPRAAVYESSVQAASQLSYLLLRTRGSTASLAPSMRAMVHDLEPATVIFSVQTLDTVRDASLARAHFITMLLLAFAGIGLVLSVVGVYGVLAHATRERTREMGIRIALGARSGQVRWMVVRQGLRLTTGGLVIGAAIALIGNRAIARLLYGVAPNDPATLAAVVLLLALTGAAASWLPAVRASRSDPAVALRAD